MEREPVSVLGETCPDKDGKRALPFESEDCLVEMVPHANPELKVSCTLAPPREFPWVSETVTTRASPLAVA